jgi:outer membrane protein assembly factor BamB
MKYVLSAPILALTIAWASPAADWPQWQGPDRTNVSKETGLLKSWPENGPKLLWTFTKAGVGYSAPAIVGNRFYTMGARGESEFLIVLDARTGKELWAKPIGPTFTFKNNQWGDGPRSTPTIDGDKIYALGAQGELACLDADSGKILWHHNLYKDYDGWVMDKYAEEPKVGWGYCEGPLVDGDQVVVTPGGDNGLLVAFNKQTGEEIWRSKDAKGKAPYSSIIVAEIGGVRQYIQAMDKGLVGVAAKDGRLLWHYQKEFTDMAINTPIFHNHQVFVTAGWNQGCYLIRPPHPGSSPPGGEGGVRGRPSGDKASEVVKVYEKKYSNEEGGVVLVGEHLYGHFDSKGWACLKFSDGEEAWLEKAKLGKGSLTCADGFLYCLSDSDGVVALVAADPVQKWQETGRFTLPQKSEKRKPAARIWTHPVVSNGRLYLRDQELIFCYDVKK